MKVSEGLRKWHDGNVAKIEQLVARRDEARAEHDRIHEEIVDLIRETEELKSWIEFAALSMTPKPPTTQ